MAIRRAGDKGAVRTCEMNTEVLKRANKKMQYYLDRLPLESQKDVVDLNRLLEKQERLIRVHIKGLTPCRVIVFNDNERYRTYHLRKRFRDAYRRGKIRRTK